MFASVSSAGTSHATLPVRGSKPIVRGPTALRVLTKQVQETAAPSTSARASDTEQIYIGFEKEDGFGPREGRKGRIIVDDPKKYPARDNELTGGWAGGEVGLWEFRNAIKEEIAANPKPEPQPKPDGKPLPGKKPVYVGFGKEPEDFKLKSKGIKGRVIYDDDAKYPGKEDLGPIAGATGGFAGGERGLRGFVETGELRLRKPGEPGGQPMSPLSIAFILLLGGGVGGVLLTNAVDVGEGVIKTDILQSPIDDNTKYLLIGALAVLGATVVLGGTKAAIDSVGEKFQESVKQLLAVGGVGVLFFLGARAILEI